MQSEYELARQYVSKAQSSETRGIPFQLSFAEYKRLRNISKCYYTGEVLNDVEGDSNQRTLDRIDASVGYVKGNVVACSLKINRKKRDLTVSEILQISSKLRKNGF